MQTPPGGRHPPWGRHPPLMHTPCEQNDTHLWKHYLAPNFVCGTGIIAWRTPPGVEAAYERLWIHLWYFQQNGEHNYLNQTSFSQSAVRDSFEGVPLTIYYVISSSNAARQLDAVTTSCPVLFCFWFPKNRTPQLNGDAGYFTNVKTLKQRHSKKDAIIETLLGRTLHRTS